jgi:hypothetical protein
LLYLEKLISQPAPERWSARDRSIRQLEAFAG